MRVGNPEGLWGRSLRGNDVLFDGNQGLSEFELMKDFRKSQILRQYEFKNQIIQNTTTAEFANRYGAANGSEKYREDFLSYLRKVNMLLEI